MLESIITMAGSTAADSMHGSGAIAESLCLDPQAQGREREERGTDGETMRMPWAFETSEPVHRNTHSPTKPRL